MKRRTPLALLLVLALTVTGLLAVQSSTAAKPKPEAEPVAAGKSAPAEPVARPAAVPSSPAPSSELLRQQVHGRVQIPGLLLMIVGALNLLPAGGMGYKCNGTTVITAFQSLALMWDMAVSLALLPLRMAARLLWLKSLPRNIPSIPFLLLLLLIN